MHVNRFVAIGDSQTEGLWDGDDTTGLRGWADRLAERLADDNPSLLYANLAVRARRIAEVRAEQFDIALAMEPDLVGICVGMNDAMALTSDLGAALDDMDNMYATLARSGATVVTTTFPDVRRIYPAARFIGARVDRLNERIRDCARRYGLRLVDLHAAPSMIDARMWAPDRVHGSSLGHTHFAFAAAEALGLDGVDHRWAEPLDGADRLSLRAHVRREIDWTTEVLGPWLWRRIRGKSTGVGRSAKRPTLRPIRSTIDVSS